MRFLLAAARVVIGGLFVWAALTKLHDLAAFSQEIANYRVLPAVIVPWMAVALPGIEIVAGLFCVAGLWTRASAGLLTGMLLVFVGALSQALLRHIQLHCGCFGGVDDATWLTVWRDVALLVPAVLVLWGGPGTLAIDSTEPASK